MCYETGDFLKRIYRIFLKTRGNQLVIGLFLLIGTICLLPFNVATASEAVQPAVEEKIEETRTALGEWVEIQQIISKEKRDLKLAREMLTERIELVENEIETLRGKISKVKENVTEADKKRVAMIEENTSLKQALGSLNGTLATLENRVREMLKQMPEVIQSRVKPLSQQFPEDGKEIKLSVSQRFQNVVGVLNEMDKFDREISVASEVREFSDGRSVEVATLYVGIGQAYYASSNGDIAGIGTASGNEWVWQERNEISGSIHDAIAILKNEKAASFIHLPMTIK